MNNNAAANVKEVGLVMPAAHTISSDVQEKLNAYVELLLKWNKTLNLVGRSTESEVWERHIEDSLQLLPLIPDTAKNLVDFGSGAGFPGLVLAAAGIENVHLVESNYRKTAFLKEAARVMGVDVKIHNERIEKLTPWTTDVITARAFAPLVEILDHAKSFMHEHTVGIFLKGANVDQEIRDAQQYWGFDITRTPSKIRGGGTILRVTQMRCL